MAAPAVFRKIGLSNWTVLAAGVILLVLHIWWFVRVSPNDRAEVISGFGAAVIVLGLWLAGLIFLRKGIEVATADAMPPLIGAFTLSASDTYHADREAMRPRVRREVLIERGIAVVVIAVGTLLNGYAAPIARLLDHAI